MKISWLGTTAVALVIGSGAVIAQSQTDQKREEGPRAQQTPSLPSKDADRPAAAGEPTPADRLKGRAATPEPKGGAKEPRRGEAPPPAERKQQAQEPRDTKQPATQQSQDDQKGRDAKQPESKQQQGQQGQPSKQDNQARDTKQPEPKQQQGQQSQPSKQDNQARDTKQPESKQQQSQPAQPKQDNQARDTKQPAETKQQQGQQQPGQQPGQAAQPSTSPQPSTSTTQQGTRPGDTGQARQGQTTGQTDPSARSGTSTSVTVNEQQRTQIVDRLRRERPASNQNINIQVNIGEQLPPRVRPRRLPPDIVRIAPQYRGYEYTVVEDRIYVVEPRTRRVVDVISESGPRSRTTSTSISRPGGERVVFTREQRETFRQVTRRTMTTAPTSASPSGTLSETSCLALQPVPEELVRANPELGAYRYLAIGDQIVLVDPRSQKVVEVID